MKRTSAELKQIARTHLQGHYGLPMGAAVIVMLAPFIIQLPFSMILKTGSLSGTLINQAAVFIIGLLSSVLSAGLIRIHLKLARNEQPVFSDLIYPFTSHPDRFLIAALPIQIISLVCSLPLLILVPAYTDPAKLAELLLLEQSVILIESVLIVIYNLFAGLVFYLLVDHEDMGVAEAFQASFHYMSGNKGRFLYITLSFFGWAFLSVLSCGIGMLWLYPYMNQTQTEFYRDVTGELDKKEADSTDNNPTYSPY